MIVHDLVVTITFAPIFDSGYAKTIVCAKADAHLNSHASIGIVAEVSQCSLAVRIGVAAQRSHEDGNVTVADGTGVEVTGDADTGAEPPKL
jgi:hypothetical protein